MKYLHFLVFAWLIVSQNCCGIIIGSTSAVSRQSSPTFPVSNVDNEMRGFALFENGFLLQNVATTCTHNSYLPVSGDITLNGGTLYLQQDMILANTFVMTNAGYIVGNNKTVQIPSSSGPAMLPNSLGAQKLMAFVASVTDAQDVVAVDWSFDGQYVCAGIAVDAGAELRIYRFANNALTLVASQDVGFGIMSARWHPSSYVIAIGIQEDTASDDFMTYLFTPPGTITRIDGELLTGNGPAVAWSPTGSYIAVASTNSSQQIRIFSVSSGVTTLVAAATLTPNRTVQRGALSWSPTEQYLVVGVSNDATAGANELLLYHFADPTLTLTVSADIGFDVTAVDYSSQGGFIAVGLAGSSQRLRVYKHTIANGTLVNQTSAQVGETLSVLSAHWDPTGTMLAMSRAAGTGTELRVYDFDLNAVTLTSAVGVDVASTDITSVRWDKTGNYLVRGGTDNLTEVYLIRDNQLVFEDVTLELNNNIRLQGAVVFRGNCSLYGNSHIIDVNATDTLLIDTNSSLWCESCQITGLHGDNLRCADNSGTLSLNNVVLTIADDVAFTRGSLLVYGDVVCTGTHLFSYRSTQTSVIKDKSCWYFDAGMSFNYDPMSASSQLIRLETGLSELSFYETSLYVTTTGLQLTKGILTIDGVCPVFSQATNVNQAFMLGDNVSAANNISLAVKPNSGLVLQSGMVRYANV